MKIGMLTWEFPPRIVGGVARHCYGLAAALARCNHEVHVVTLDFPGAPNYEEVKGVKIHRTAIEIGHPNFFTWTFIFNHFMEKQVGVLSREIDFDVFHIHDWLSAPSGIASKHLLKKPLVVTMHSTENGRSGLYNPDSITINGMEWWATYEAKKVIVTSNSMKGEVCGHFHLPQEKVVVIPNGIDVAKFAGQVDRWKVRSRYGVHPNEKLILCVGRLVPQKGIEYLIRAVPQISRSYHDTKFVIVGEGWLRNHLEYIANSTGHRWKINFTGFIPDSELVALLMSADVLVVPSIYEPFGIVALEGMAAGVPVVTSQVGGLAEVVQHDQTGAFVYPRSPESIAWGITHILFNPKHAEYMVENARRMVQNTYSWEAIAKRTGEVFKETVGEG